MGQGLADSPFAGSSCLEGLQGSSPGLQRGPRWPSAQRPALGRAGRPHPSLWPWDALALSCSALFPQENIQAIFIIFFSFFSTSEN